MIGLSNFTERELRAACEDGNAEGFQPRFLYALDQWRERLGTPVVFMPTQSRRADGVVQPVAGWCSFGHAPKSRHYEGEAGDFYFPTIKLGTALLYALRFPAWTGIGVYPFWNPDPGLHLDVRQVLEPEHGWGMRVVWWVDAEGMYRYLTTEDDIMNLFMTLPRVA